MDFYNKQFIKEELDNINKKTQEIDELTKDIEISDYIKNQKSIKEQIYEMSFKYEENIFKNKLIKKLQEYNYKIGNIIDLEKFLNERCKFNNKENNHTILRIDNIPEFYWLNGYIYNENKIGIQNYINIKYLVSI